MTVTEPTNETTEPAAPAVDDHAADAADALVTDDVLVEEISIDGMCGVY